jgi:hypothetical protein
MVGKDMLHPQRSLIITRADVFNVENDLNEDHSIGTLRQGNTTSKAPSPSCIMGRLQHLVKLPPQTVRSTQIDPNEIQLDDNLEVRRLRCRQLKNTTILHPWR